MTPPDASRQLVFVTNASSGIGKAAAREIARRGFHVLAGVRREADAAAIRGSGVEPVVLDITEATHVAALTERVRSDRERPLRAIVNNAGAGADAPVEVFDLGAAPDAGSRVNQPFSAPFC